MAAPDLCPLPAGEVELHDARRRRRWSVQLEPYEIGAFPVTEAEYRHVMGGAGSGLGSPVVDLSWLDAVTFCNAASMQAL